MVPPKNALIAPSNRTHTTTSESFSFLTGGGRKDAQDSMPAHSDKKKGVAYASLPGSSYAGPLRIINNIFNSDLEMSLQKEDDSLHNREIGGEVSVSGRDFALVSGDMWLQALKWYCPSCKDHHQASKKLDLWRLPEILVRGFNIAAM